jgi:hypothetical protein
MVVSESTGGYVSLAAQRRTIVATGIFILAIFSIDFVHHHYLDRSTIGNILSWLTGSPTGADSWFPMRTAYYHFSENPDAALYRDIFFEQGDKFQYPPSSLLMFSATDALGIQLSDEALNVVGWISVMLLTATVAILAAIIAGRTFASPKDRMTIFMTAVTAALGTITFYPVVKGFNGGQIQTWLNAWFALACLAFLLDRRTIAGAFIGAICIFKPQLGLFLIWAALRREWDFVVGWCAVMIPAAVASLAVFGLENHLDYLSVLGFLSERGEAFYPNQSMNGLLHRLLGNGDSLYWHGRAFPPYSAFVYVGTLLTSSALIAGTLVYRMRASTTLMDFLIAGLTFTLASPIAWEHHYGILPVMFAVLGCLWLSRDPSAPPLLQGLVLIAAFTFASRFWPSMNLLAGTWLSVLQSYLYLAALAVLWLLYKERDRFPPWTELTSSLRSGLASASSPRASNAATDLTSPSVKSS